MFDQLRIAKDHQDRLRAEAENHRRAAQVTVETTIVETATRTTFRRPELVIGSVFPATR